MPKTYKPSPWGKTEKVADDSWVRALNSCNKAIGILRSRGMDIKYIAEENMPANWQEMGRLHKHLWGLVYGRGTREKPTGTCYEDAARFVIKQDEGMLVHGTAISLGRRLGHAWVELSTGYIWEPYSGEYLTNERFQALVDPIEESRYTPEEVAIMTLRTGNFGPWTEEEKRGLPMRN